MKSLRETVRLLRTRAGFRSARAFHRGWCRRDEAACGYKAYCEIEAGRLVPTPALASSLAKALQVQPGTRRAEIFRSSYLYSTTHSGPLTRLLLAALHPETNSNGLAERVLNASMTRGRYVLTTKQRRLLVENSLARSVLIALQARPRPWTPADMANALGLSAAATRFALRGLVTVGLARGGPDVYICPHRDQNIVFPKPTRDEMERMGRSAFKEFPFGSWSRQCVVLFRAEHDVARRFAGRMERTATTAHAFQRRSGAGGIFSSGAFVWKIS